MASEVAILNLISSVVNQVIPLVLTAVKAHQSSTPSTLPTIAQVKAQINPAELAIIAQGVAWTAAQPKEQS